MNTMLVSASLQKINSQITLFESNPNVPLDKKGSVSNWREELDNITKDYQRDSENLMKEYEKRYESKGDEIQQRISDILKQST